MNKIKLNVILALLFIICLNICLNNAQQPTNASQTDGKGLKAMVESKNDTVAVKIDVIRKEMRDFMRECGVDLPEEDDAKGNVEVANKGTDKTTNTNKLGNLNMAPMASDNLSDGRNKKKKKGTYPTSYGNAGKKRKNKKRRGNNNDCDDDVDDSCEDEDNNSDDDDDSDEDEDDRRTNKGKKKGRGGRRGGRNRRNTSTLVEQFNTTVDGQEVVDTETNESFKNKKDKRRGGNKRGGNRDDDDDEDEDEDDDGAPNRCGNGGGRNKGKGKGGKNHGGGGKKKGKGGRGANKSGGGKKHGGGGDDGFGGAEDGRGAHGGGHPFETGAGGLGPGMGDHYGYPGLSGSEYFHGNPYGYGSYAGYIGQIGDSEVLSRIKRQEEKIDCVSQCVFGYLEILDDNRVPSETALISYYQEKIMDNDKKSEMIRNVRRCFGKLVATDTEDGCKFSKAVSKCLNLELDP